MRDVGGVRTESFHLNEMSGASGVRTQMEENLWWRMEWEMMSKVALRSIRMRRKRKPNSAGKRRLLVILISDRNEIQTGTFSVTSWWLDGTEVAIFWSRIF